MSEADPQQFFRALACRSVASLIKQQTSPSAPGIALETEALDLLAQLLSLSMLNICATAKHWASTGKRTQINAVDVHRTMQMRGSSPTVLLSFLSASKGVAEGKRVAIDYSAVETNSAPPSPMPGPAIRCIKLETNYRPKHFYDFLPSLPSVHTYKRTSNKYISSSDKAFIAYRKAEERRLMEKNLNHLWQQSGHSALWTTGRLNYDE